MQTVHQLGSKSATVATAWLPALETSLREEIERALESGETSGAGHSNEHESRLLSDQAQMLLRQGQPNPALQLFDRALLASEQKVPGGLALARNGADRPGPF